MIFKQPLNGARLGLKPTQKNKKNKIKEKHRMGGHFAKVKQLD
jgi:hypothetical protein